MLNVKYMYQQPKVTKRTKKKSKPLVQPEWNSQTQDMTVYKLSNMELVQKKIQSTSKNLQFIKENNIVQKKQKELLTYINLLKKDNCNLNSSNNKATAVKVRGRNKEDVNNNSVIMNRSVNNDFDNIRSHSFIKDLDSVFNYSTYASNYKIDCNKLNKPKVTSNGTFSKSPTRRLFNSSLSCKSIKNDNILNHTRQSSIHSSKYSKVNCSINSNKSKSLVKSYNISLIENKDKVCEKIKMNVNFQVIKTKAKKKGKNNHNNIKEKNSNESNNIGEVHSLHTIITTNRSGLTETKPAVMNLNNRPTNNNININKTNEEELEDDYDYQYEVSNYAEEYESNNLKNNNEKSKVRENYSCLGNQFKEKEKINYNIEYPDISKNYNLNNPDEEDDYKEENDIVDENFPNNSNKNNSKYPQSLDLCMQLLNESLKKSNEVLSKTILSKQPREKDFMSEVNYKHDNSNIVYQKNDFSCVPNNDFEKYKKFLN